MHDKPANPFGYERFVPVCKVIRGLTSGDKGLIATPDEWAEVVRLTDPRQTGQQNPWWEIVGSIRDVYSVLAQVHGVKSAEAEDEFGFEI